jgi:hypothetical protein
MATKASRIALAGSNISSTGEVDADLLDNIDSAGFLSLDSNGRLGIGTSSPDVLLHVQHTSVNEAFIVANRYNDTSTGSDFRPIFAVAEADPHSSGVTATIIGNHNRHIHIGPYFGPDGTTGAVGALTILSTGRVGIGESNPDSKLHIRDATDGGSSSTTSAIQFSRRSGGANDATIKMQHDGSDGISNLQFHFGTSERMRIDSSGRVGIGTSSMGYPGYADNLTIADTANAGITIRSGTSNEGNIYFSDATGTGTGTYAGYISYRHAIDALNLATTAGISMTINSLGNVGIGTSTLEGSASAIKVEVESGSNYRPMRLRFVDDNNGSTNNPLAFEYKAGLEIENIYSGAAPSANGTKIAKLSLTTVTSSGYGATGSIFVTTNAGTGYNSGELAFAVGSNSSGLETEAMRINKDGKIGIGTTNPQAILSLNGGSTCTQTFQSSWSNGIGRISFVGGSTGVDGSAANSTGAKIESLTTAPGGAATGDLKFIVNSGDHFETGMEITHQGTVRLALQGTHTTIGSNADDRAPYGYNNITVNNHADVLWGFNSRLITGGGGHDYEVVSSHGSINNSGIMLTGNGNPESPNNILFFANGGSATAGTVYSPSDRKFTMNSGGSFVAETGSGGAVIRLGDIGNTGTSSHYIELSSNLPGYANGKYNCLKTNMGDMHFAAGGVYTGYISHNSGFVDVSDQSLKENVVTIDGALSKVNQLQGRYFTWIDENQSDDRQIGFIAQEVEAVIPELVTTSDTGIKGVSYGKATALLVEAIKEQQTMIEQLQARLTAAGIE